MSITSATSTASLLPGVTTTYQDGMGHCNRATSICLENGAPSDLFLDDMEDDINQFIRVTQIDEDQVDGRLVQVKIDLTHITTGFAPCTTPVSPEHDYAKDLRARHSAFIENLAMYPVTVPTSGFRRGAVMASILCAYELRAAAHQLTVHNLSWNWDTLELVNS